MIIYIFHHVMCIRAKELLLFFRRHAFTLAARTKEHVPGATKCAPCALAPVRARHFPFSFSIYRIPDMSAVGYEKRLVAT